MKLQTVAAISIGVVALAVMVWAVMPSGSSQKSGSAGTVGDGSPGVSTPRTGQPPSGAHNPTATTGTVTGTPGSGPVTTPPIGINQELGNLHTHRPPAPEPPIWERRGSEDNLTWLRRQADWDHRDRWDNLPGYRFDKQKNKYIFLDPRPEREKRYPKLEFCGLWHSGRLDKKPIHIEIRWPGGSATLQAFVAQRFMISAEGKVLARDKDPTRTDWGQLYLEPRRGTIEAEQGDIKTFKLQGTSTIQWFTYDYGVMESLRIPFVFTKDVDDPIQQELSRHLLRGLYLIAAYGNRRSYGIGANGWPDAQYIGLKNRYTNVHADDRQMVWQRVPAISATHAEIPHWEERDVEANLEEFFILDSEIRESGIPQISTKQTYRNRSWDRAIHVTNVPNQAHIPIIVFYTFPAFEFAHMWDSAYWYLENK